MNYGPIAPEESRLIFAREALVYQRLKRRPDWLLANDAAVREAQQMEERLRTRDLVHAAESFVEFYDAQLPRQVSSAATLEHFNRHLSPPQRAALTLTPERIFARRPTLNALAQFPENTHVEELTVPVEYRFAPGETQDGANLKVPLLALPSLTRAAIDAAIPGLAAPRIEALLRSLPKDARRSLIPVAATAAAFLADTQGATADTAHLKAWLKERRGITEALLRFDTSAVPVHLTPHLRVMHEGREVAHGTELERLRRDCAVLDRAELDRQARAAYMGNWRRFELDQLPERVPLTLEQGTIWVFPALEQRELGLHVQYQWSAEEAERIWRDGSVRLARAMLERQSRDLAKTIGSSVSLLLSASPYLGSDALIDALLQLTMRCACFAEAEAPRAKAEFEAAVDKGRERLYPCLDQMSTMIQAWLKEAGEVRQTLDDSRVRLQADAAEETRRHLKQLLDFATINTSSLDWLRQVPRYLKAEQRRWQRNTVRGSEPKHIVPELQLWSARYQDLEKRLAAELRWTPKLTELRFWIEEYRVSLYAQELKTLGPISAARLEQRAAEIEAWLSR